MPIMRQWRMRAAMIIAFLPAACGGQNNQVTSPRDAMATVTPEESQVGAYLAGQHALHEHDFKAASRYYGNALRVDPTNVSLLKRTYALLAAEGNLDEAITLVERLKALKEEDPVAGIMLATRAARDENYAEVERIMAIQPRQGFNKFIAPLMLAWSRAGQGRIDAALETVNDLKKSNSLTTLSHFHSGMINDMAHRPAAAAKHYDMVIASEGALSLRALEIIGAFYRRTGQPDKVQALRDLYVNENPATVLLTEPEDKATAGMTPRTGFAETLFGIANSIREESATDAALLFSRLALAVQPDFALAQVLTGDILHAQTRFADANAVYRAIGQESAVYYLARLRMAGSLYKSGPPKEAMAVLEALAQQWPEQTQALIDLGDILRSEKRFAEAALAYGKALVRLPVLKKYHWRVFYSRGIAHERSQQWAAAEKDFLKALEMEPDQPMVLNYLGYSWLEQRTNLLQAKDMLQRAVAQRPEDGSIVDSLGWALYLTGDYPGAVQELERAVELESNDPTVNDHLGDAYWRAGRRKEARFQWQRALSLNPEEPGIQENIRRKLERGLDPE
ncbi:MAG: TPR repeat-containing protein [Rhodospirillaceae bacterium]|nr:MAG: TPR repeat-containing protein [Rhodospirillaceae bacterium]